MFCKCFILHVTTVLYLVSYLTVSCSILKSTLGAVTVMPVSVFGLGILFWTITVSAQDVLNKINK